MIYQCAGPGKAAVRRLSSASTMRLTKQWTDGYYAVCQRDLSSVDYMYAWADDIHVGWVAGQPRRSSRRRGPRVRITQVRAAQATGKLKYWP